jgi:hypothetical protein
VRPGTTPSEALLATALEHCSGKQNKKIIVATFASNFSPCSADYGCCKGNKAQGCSSWQKPETLLMLAQSSDILTFPNAVDFY